MSDFYEIRMHGRGGQGAKTGAQLIAEAGFMMDDYVQAFPEYGPERAGAPMRTFARISKNIIKTFSPITTPDALIVIDETLLCKKIIQDLASNGLLIVNTRKSPEKIRKKVGFKGKVGVVDATGISISLMNVNKPNLITTGAFIKATNQDIINLDNFNKAIKEHFGKKIAEKNVKGVKKAFEEAVIK